jgi:hypothetical protein
VELGLSSPLQNETKESGHPAYLTVTSLLQREIENKYVLGCVVKDSGSVYY